MLQNVLAVASAEVQTAQDEQYTLIEPDNAAFISGSLTLFFYGLIDLLTSFLNGLLYLSWLNTAVFDEFFQCDACNMAADWVE